MSYVIDKYYNSLASKQLLNSRDERTKFDMDYFYSNIDGEHITEFKNMVGC